MVLSKKIIVTGLTFFVLQPLSAWNVPTWSEIDKSSYTKPLLAGVTLLSSCWALKEWRQRVGQKRELEGRLADQANYAHNEIEKLKNEIKRAQDDEEYILELSSFIEKLQKHYRAEQEYLTLDVRPYIYWSNLLQSYDGSLEAYEKRLQQDSSEVHNYIQQMEENLKRWEQRKCLFEEAKQLFKQLELFQQQFIQWVHVIHKQRDFIHVQVLMTFAYREKHAFELQALERELSLDMLNTYIGSLYKEEKFPFVQYAQSLHEEIEKLTATLAFTQDTQRELFLPAQEALIEDAQNVLKALEIVYNYVITTTYWREQKLAAELEQMTHKVKELEKQTAQGENFSAMKKAGTLFSFTPQAATSSASYFSHSQDHKVKSDNPFLSGAVVSGLSRLLGNSHHSLQKSHYTVGKSPACVSYASTHTPVVTTRPTSATTLALTYSPVNKTVNTSAATPLTTSLLTGTVCFAHMIGKLLPF